MTQNPFEPSPAPADELEEGGRDRKALLVGGGLVAALLLGAGAYLMIGGGDADDATATPITRAPSASSAPAETAPPVDPAAAPALEVVPAVSDVEPGRNPYRALYTEPVAAPEEPESSDDGSDPEPTTPVVTGPAGGSTGAGGGTPAAGGGTPTSPVTAAPYPLTFTAISQPTDPQEGRVYTFTIDGVDLQVVPAQRFGRYGELVVLGFVLAEDGGAVREAVVQVGDAAPLQIAVGETREVL